MKKKFRLFTLVLLLAIIAAGCSQSTLEQPEEFDRDYAGDLGEVDLSGKTFRMGSHWIGEYYMDIGLSESGDKMRDRYRETEKKFNITMQFLGGGYCGEIDIATRAAAQLPEEIPDFMDVSGDQAYSMFKKDMLYPFDLIETMDVYSEKYGAANYVTCGANWNGHRWNIYPNNWQMIPQYPGIVIFNNSNLRLYGYFNKPYEMMENKDWTWASFEPMIDDIYRQSGKGLGYDESNFFGKTVIYANGGLLVDESGEIPVSGFRMKQTQEALQWMADMGAKKLIRPEVPSNYPLTNGYSFMFDQAYHATLLEDPDRSYCVSLEDYGVVPFPWGPSAEYGQASSLIHSNRRFICANALSANDMDEVGIIIDFLFEPLDGDPEEAWQKNLYYTLIHQQDVDNYIWMCKNVRYTYDFEFGAAQTKITSGITKITNGTASVAEIIESIEELANGELLKNYEIQNH